MAAAGVHLLEPPGAPGREGEESHLLGQQPGAHGCQPGAPGTPYQHLTGHPITGTYSQYSRLF